MGAKASFELTSAAHGLHFRECCDDADGARPLKRAIQRLIMDPLSMRILEGEGLPGDHVIVGADSGADEMKFESAPAPETGASNGVPRGI